MLKKMINRYVELRRSTGFKFRTQNYLLQNFGNFAEKQGDTYVRMKTVFAWASLAPSTAQKRNRLHTVRRFSIAMQIEDKRYDIPPSDIFGSHMSRRRLPFILSTNELKLLLSAAMRLKPKHSIRPISYATLFALLTATGLRVSEALNLKLSDITSDGLMIRATKFRKDRLVPLHKKTWDGIQRYLKYRKKYGYNNNPFLFVSNIGAKLQYSTVCSIFLQLTRATGLRGKPGQPGVSLHDLRYPNLNKIQSFFVSA